MQTTSDSPEFAFLQGGGEMGRLTRAFDWAKTSLGPPSAWPQSLKTTLGVILNSKFPMFLFWGEELLCFYNDAYRPSLGNDGKHPDALGKPAAKIWPEIWESLVEPLTTRIRAGGEATWSEDQLIPIYRNGRMEDVYWTFSYSPVFDEAGKVAGVLVTCTETTGKVVNLKKLADSKDQLQFAIEAAELATWDYNPVTERFVASSRFKKWFGIPEDREATLEEGLARVIDEDRNRVEAAFRRAMEHESGGEYHVEYTIVNKRDGGRRNVLAKGRAWFNEKRVAYRVNGTVQDVTKDVLAREKVEAEKTRYLTLLEAIPNMAWHTDAGGKLTYINQRWYDYTGQTAEETYNGGWEIATHSDDLPAAVERMVHSLATGEPYTTEYRLRRTDGTYRWHLARATAIRDGAGEIASWLGTITDIHEQKQTQIRLDELIRQRTRQLEDSIRDLQRSNENLQQFAYVASHDLQEPLRKIQSFGDLITRKYSDRLGEGADYLGRMQTAASRMSTLIHDLLTYSRITTRQQMADAVALDEVLEGVLASLELRIQESGAVIESSTLPIVRGDATQLSQLFQNLLSNALKFGPEDRPPAISISSKDVQAEVLPAHVRPVREASAYHCIEVADNGIGFEEKYLDRIFEVFQRLHGRSQYTGTGVGLAICKKVAANHGGAITATSQSGKGATFSVYLPV